MPWWMPPGAIGVLFVLGGGWLVVVAGRRALASGPRVGWRRVPGTVVGWEAVRDGGTHPGEVLHRTMFPVVEYPLPDGSTRRFRNPTTLDTGYYRTGRSVVVLVDPADPQVAELATANRDRAAGRALFTVLGTVLGGLGVVVLAVVVVVARALG